MPCPCGSGLRAARCCAVPAAAFQPESAERPLAPLLHQAQTTPDPDAAAALCVEILELSPGHRAALWRLATLRRGTGAEEPLLRRLLARDPNHLPATNALARALIDRGAPHEAEPHARNAIRLAPRHPHSHSLLALALTAAGAPAFAETHYRRALALLGTRDPALLASLAHTLHLQGKRTEARTLYEEATTLDPANPHAWLGLARLEQAEDNLPQAATCLDRAEALAPATPAIHLLRAELHIAAGNQLAALAALPPPAGLAAEELLHQGRLLDRLGRHPEAFAAVTEANARLRGQTGHAPSAEADALTTRLTAFFIRRRLASLPRVPQRGEIPLPMFILGFPRSGAGLLERMVAAHGSISPGGTRPLIDDIAALIPHLLMAPLPYPEALTELWMADRADGLAGLRAHYLRRLAGAMPAATPYVTDATPLNETHLGLITLLFPDAPLIRLQRHPFETVLSAFARPRRTALDLVSLAQHYARTDALIRHYETELDRAPLVIRFESLVTAPEPELRRVLNAAGLELEPECLQLPLHPPPPRWQNYRRELEPAMPILRGLAERLGYEVD
jgi:Flp pilus assembly protein TadD